MVVLTGKALTGVLPRGEPEGENEEGEGVGAVGLCAQAACVGGV